MVWNKHISNCTILRFINPASVRASKPANDQEQRRRGSGRPVIDANPHTSGGDL
jgi:hypothetical protein